MPAVLDHLLIPARDRRAAAERLAAILDVPWAAQAAVGPFSAVYVSGDLTVDFDEVAVSAAVPQQHYAFRVGEALHPARSARRERRNRGRCRRADRGSDWRSGVFRRTASA